MKKALLGAVVVMGLAWSNAALAKPVFLICKLTDRGGESQFDVQLNEEASTASYFIHRGGISVKKPAIFTPEKVLFNGFEIDRRDLTFRRDNTTSAFYNPDNPAYDVGSCELDTTERAF